MKFWQFFFILAAIYIAPHASYATCMALAAAWTIAGFVALSRKE